MTDEAWPGADAPDDDYEPQPDDWELLDDHEKFDIMEARWQAVGHVLAEARMRLGISKREAARRADLSDGAWRHLEAGSKTSYGTIILPNPRPENLAAAARAVGLNPAVVFQAAGLHLPESLRYTTDERPTGLTTADGRSISLEGLSDADIDLIVALVERLTRRDAPQS